MDCPLLGSWRLISVFFTTAKHQVRHPLGRQVVGLLTYDQAGLMAVQLYSAERPAFECGDHTQGTNNEIRQAYNSSMCYFGRYRIDEDRGLVIHNIEGCTFPNWVGHQQQRHYQIDDSGSVLTLITPPLEIEGVVQTGRLVWRRSD